MQKTINHYSVLGISPSASGKEIESAYDQRLQQIEANAGNVTPKQLTQQINQINQAYWALSDRGRRAQYDTSSDMANGIPQFSVEVRETGWTSPRGVLNLVGRVIVMALLIQVGWMLINAYIAYQANGGPSAAEQEKIQKSYDALNGKLSPEEVTSAQELAEKQRQEAAAEQKRREQEDALRRQEWELERNRSYAQEVSSNLRSAEEQAQQQAEEEKRRQAELEQEKQEKERQRIERLREKWRSGGSGSRPDTSNDEE